MRVAINMDVPSLTVFLVTQVVLTMVGVWLMFRQQKACSRLIPAAAVTDMCMCVVTWRQVAMKRRSSMVSTFTSGSGSPPGMARTASTHRRNSAMTPRISESR